ncbi:hypothetical protein Acid345_2581 [Candidatus Koribacter versatilis Ellin345]|uniref:Lipoprotein n=1 Tax=Koribacter versatilis (strain Ellin345) TaxID=204669 RepID=Q1ING8_KORVE|nr:hypothetical protein Acid345_2581 [Candidatus Koribacter versatilis Ellin345]
MERTAKRFPYLLWFFLLHSTVAGCKYSPTVHGGYRLRFRRISVKKTLFTLGATLFAIAMLMPVSAAAQTHGKHHHHHKGHHHHHHAS